MMINEHELTSTKEATLTLVSYPRRKNCPKRYFLSYILKELERQIYFILRLTKHARCKKESRERWWKASGNFVVQSFTRLADGFFPLEFFEQSSDISSSEDSY